ncbi:MAG: dihydroorotate dehydrogenase electron transfer subunit [Clostridiales bacterium]|nr:dihydroorotate dehydrogenase electron transfer subunit [Clostridiales bacterium]
MNQTPVYTVVFHRSVAKDTMHIGIDVGKGREDILPGQFMNLKVPGRPDLILRRPISINCYDRETGILEMVYQVKGQGTAAFASLREGDSIDVLGPLGNGFIPKEEKNVWLIGGGIGVAPLRYLPKYYKDIKFSGIFGFRNQEWIYQQQEFSADLAFADYYTDDGSNGNQGFVTDGLLKRLNSEAAPDMIYACGPLPMLRALKDVVLKAGIPALVSMEERMGCGTGICVVCTCEVEIEGQAMRKRVCTDGPVFDIREVKLHG